MNRAASVPESPVLFSSSLMSRESGPDDNVTVIEVSTQQHAPHSAVPLDYQGVFNFNFVEDALASLPDTVPSGSSTFHENLDFREDTEFNETSYTPSITPPSTVERQLQVTASVTAEQGFTNSNGNPGNTQIEVTDSGSSYYECVFLPNVAQSPRSLDSPVSNSAAINLPGNEVEVAPRPSETPSVRNAVTEVRGQGPVTFTDPALSDIQQRRRHRSSSTSEATSSSSSSSGASHALRVTTVAGAERNRVVAQQADVERRLQPAPHPYRQAQVCCFMFTIFPRMVSCISESNLHSDLSFHRVFNDAFSAA